MQFASDNWAGAHPSINEAISQASAGMAEAYGSSDWDRRVQALFSDIFERDVAVFFVATGTAANALAMTNVSRPGGVGFCHREAHLIADECGAAQYLTGGARLMPVDGALGKIDPLCLEAEIGRFPPGFVHGGQPMAVSLTQASEAGTVYRPDEIETIVEIARRHRLPVHMDGARFANAMVHLGLSPAEMTWKRGIDILSFGATKNGCWCAEALVFLDPDRSDNAPFVHKRAAQLFSKSRFVAAQFEAYFRNDLWIELARHANGMADRLRAGIARSGTVRLAWPSQINETFAIMPKPVAAALRAEGAAFHDWAMPRNAPPAREADETLVRLVTSFATAPEDVDALTARIA